MIEYMGYAVEWMPCLREGNIPKYLQIAECIENDIKKGILPTGYKLPPQRLIANYLELNLSTVTKAYKYCEGKGLIHGITGKGTFVSNTYGMDKSVISEPRESIIELGALHPLYETNGMLGDMIDELSPHFDRKIMYQYIPVSGHPKHKYIASKWLENLNIGSNPERMLITSGAQNALYTILATEFSSGDSIVVDELTYSGLINSASMLGINLIPVPNDDRGISIDAIKGKLKTNRVKGLYLMPDCQNPTMVIMSEMRRREIANLAMEKNLLIIEDSVFRFATNMEFPTLYSLAPNHCYHIASISKLINPGFRIAYLLIPNQADISKLEFTLHNLVFMPSSMTSEILSCLQSSFKLDELLKHRRDRLVQMNKVYDEVFELESLERHDLFRFIELSKDKLKGIDVEKELLKSNIQVFSADRFRVIDDVGKMGIRVSVCSCDNDDILKENLLILKSLIKRWV